MSKGIAHLQQTKLLHLASFDNRKAINTWYLYVIKILLKGEKQSIMCNEYILQDHLSKL